MPRSWASFGLWVSSLVGPDLKALRTRLLHIQWIFPHMTAWLIFSGQRVLKGSGHAWVRPSASATSSPSWYSYNILFWQFFSVSFHDTQSTKPLGVSVSETPYQFNSCVIALWTSSGFNGIEQQGQRDRVIYFRCIFLHRRNVIEEYRFNYYLLTIKRISPVVFDIRFLGKWNNRI